MAVSRVIEVSFGRSSVALVRIDTAYFYNNGIIFKPTDIDLPASYQVHWADSPQASSTLETIGTAEGTPIPDDLWDRSRVIYGWIYLHPTEDSGVTGYEVRIYKNVRAGLPDGTEPTPAEQSTIDQLIGALNSAVEQTGEDVESASQSAQSAESAKTAAESARDTAGEYANDAESSAASASASASQASTSATVSAQSASDAETARQATTSLVAEAQGYADTSAQSASASANSASQAQGFAQSASASANSASGYASQADISANTASTKASEASTSAQTASAKATEAAQSASQALGYKNDAESAKTASQTAQGLAESARDTAVSAKTDAESARDDAETARDEAQSAVASISGALAEKAPVITDTASGSIASFSDGADGLPLKSLVVDINPIQDLSHGDPSPENLCPISGWTEVDVEQSGKNLFDSKFSDYTKPYDYYIKPIKLEYSNRYVIKAELVGTAVTGTAFGITKKGDKYSEFTPYLVVTTSGTVASFEFVADGTFTSPKLIAYVSGQAKFDEAMSNYNITLEVKADQNPYEPYSGTFLNIQLGQTVYGGKLDVLSGELVIDRAMQVYDGSADENWERHSSGSASAFAMKISLVHAFVSSNANIISNYLTAISSSATWGNYDNWISSSSSGVLNTGIKSITDVETWRTYLASNPLEVCYALATPITIQLTSNQVNSLLGVNNLWADSGNTEVEYRADTKLFIERLTAPDSADMIADANITSGQYFMVGNSLYKATANIANGSAIVVGTNCTRVSLAQALNEINA